MKEVLIKSCSMRPLICWLIVQMYKPSCLRARRYKVRRSELLVCEVNARIRGRIQDCKAVRLKVLST